eukprot:6212273-Pleurochrysis_carterae.AAC.1
MQRESRKESGRAVRRAHLVRILAVDVAVVEQRPRRRLLEAFDPVAKRRRQRICQVASTQVDGSPTLLRGVEVALDESLVGEGDGAGTVDVERPAAFARH